MRSSIKKFWVALAFAAALPARGPCDVQTGPTEYQVKAAFLYNFAKFVEWPNANAALSPSAEPFVIGVLGQDPFGEALPQELDGKTINGQPLVLKHPATLQEAAACNVLFIGASEQKRVAVILDALNGHAVLTVSDLHGFVRHGGMIEFSIDDQRIHFSINRGAATLAHLTISSQLLKLAKTVRENP